jgi:hypothetical protein
MGGLFHDVVKESIRSTKLRNYDGLSRMSGVNIETQASEPVDQAMREVTYIYNWIEQDSPVHELVPILLIQRIEAVVMVRPPACK